MTRVLVADDDTDNRALMAAVLTSMGIEVVTASTGETALVAARAGDLDAVLLDVRMPGMTGIEVTEAMRAAGFADVPVLLISACAAPAEIERGLAAGADDYLVKPFRIADFVRRVTHLIDAPRPAISPALLATLASRSSMAGMAGRRMQPLSSAMG